MKSQEEIQEVIDHYKSNFKDRLNEDINNPKFNRTECTDYMDRIIVTVLEWVLED